MTGLVFSIVVVLNITALFVIIKKFFRIGKFNGKKSSWSIVAKVFSVILNLVLAFGVFRAVVFGLFLISAYGLFGYKGTIYTYDFEAGLILLETAVFLPHGLNFLLYKIWYRKVNISKWWIFPSIIIGVGVIALTVLNVISDNYINYWETVEWIGI